MLNIRTTGGEIGILAHHIPLASGVEISEMNYLQEGKRFPFAIGGGFVYVGEDNVVTVIANSVESPEEIDLHRAEESKKRAEERLKDHHDDTDLRRAEIALQKALIRINVKSST